MPELNISWDALGKWLLGALVAAFLYWGNVIDRAADRTLTALSEIQIAQGRILERLDMVATSEDLERVKSQEALTEQKVDQHLSSHEKFDVFPQTNRHFQDRRE